MVINTFLYAQVTEADLQEAAKMSLLGHAEKRVQNRVHDMVQNQDEPRDTKQNEAEVEPTLNPYECESLQELAGCYKSLQDKNLYPLGESNP
jgi:hypothetical protein